MRSFVPVDPLCTGQEEQESKALASWTNKTGKACPLGGVQGRCVLLYNILGNHKSQTGGKTHTKKICTKLGDARPAQKKQQRCQSVWAGRSALCSVWATSGPWIRLGVLERNQLNSRPPALKGTTRLPRYHQMQGGSGLFRVIYLGRLPGRRCIASVIYFLGQQAKKAAKRVTLLSQDIKYYLHG